MTTRISFRPTTGPAPRGQVAGTAIAIGDSVSTQTGAAIGALAFPGLGAVGVVAVRQLVTGLVLGAVARPRFGELTAAQWRPVLGLALAFSTMNTGLYVAVDRIGLGLAVTLEFLGPLAVAVCSSRRAVDALAALVAGAGVLVLTNPGPSTDLVGIGTALVAAASWAAYILLNRTIGRRVRGVQGTAAAAVLSAAVWTPVAVALFVTHPPSPRDLALAVTCGLLASVVPFAGDVLALRRIPAGLFSTLTSLNPVWAALAGWAVLGEVLGVHETVGIALVVASNVVVTSAGLLRRSRRRTRRSA